MDQTGKLAFVIGGTEGIGLALAQLLLKSSADVVIASRSKEKQEKALTELQRDCNDGQRLAARSLDITDYAAMKTRLDEMISEFGVPDILINSAGVAHPQYIDQIDVAKIDQMIDLNFRGTVYLCRHMVPHMVKKGRGQIMNVSSVAGYVGLFGYTTYCGSKSAVIAFSEALREELIYSGVKVSVLCPPNTRTPGLDRENEFKPQEVLAIEEKVKVLEPAEVAAYALKKLARGSFMIIPTLDSKVAFYLKRYAPCILRKFVKRPKPETQTRHLKC